MDAGIKALDDLRRTRRKNRLADLDWFEAAYRVYLVAFAFGGTALWASSFIKDSKVSDATMADIYEHGPAVLGMLAVVALAAGIRSGSRGGPLALEEADVRHVLLAPIDRRRALLRPAFQRARSAAFGGLLVGALAGQLAGKRLLGSDASWTFAGAAFGLTLGLAFVAAALVAHALRIARWLASLAGALLIAWQAAAVWQGLPGPGNLDGSFALWGARQRAVDLLAPVAIVALTALGLLLLRRTSLDALARRSGLVAQLRFAVTMQDLRTVMLLRRQLSQENTRNRPWIRIRRAGGASVMWRRGWHSLLRFPVSRLLRMTLLAIGAAACQVAVFRGTSALFLLSGCLLFLLGMEALEPLSQEIDQPDRLASLPHSRGEILVRHTIVPMIVLLPFAAIGVAVAAVVEGSAGAPAVAAVLALPTMWLGAAGSVVSIVKDAPDISSAAVEQTMLPPEMSGLTTIVRTLIPLIVSVLGSTGVLIVRSAHEAGNSEIGAAVRVGVAQLILVGLVAVWVKRRDEWRRKFKSMMAEGREVTAQQRSAAQPGSEESVMAGKQPSNSRHPKPPGREPQPAAGARGTPAAGDAVAKSPQQVSGGALAANELTKDYGDRPALAPLTLLVPEHQRVAVVGHNGSGKTTLIRMAAGLLDPSGGTVHIMGHASGTTEARRALAYLSDSPTFYDDLSLWEHLEYIARLHGVEEWDQLAADLLGHLGLYDRADDLPNTFSRGLRQKAAIALAFVRPFDILLVDEPFVGLDSAGRAALLELLDSAADDGAALVVATHELSYVERVPRLVALRDGELVHDGPATAADVADLVLPPA